MPKLMAQQAREHTFAETVVAPSKPTPLLEKYDFTSSFVPTGPLPSREKYLQMKGPIDASSTLALMEAHE